MSFLLLLLGISSAQAAWGLNDVSFLLPIQGAEGPGLLFRAGEEAELGVLLPKSIYAKIGKLASFEEAEITYGKLRVVGFRIDPCFLGEPQSKDCRPMIRFVWQPLNTNSVGKVMADDAAIHTFYDLPPADFEKFAADLSALSAQSGLRFDETPLGVHPILTREGLKGPFFARLKKLVFHYVGARALTRMTFMRLAGAGSMWDFGGFNITARGPVAIPIPGLAGKPRQVFVNGASPRDVDYISSQLLPEPTGSRNVNWLISDSRMVRSYDRQDLVIANVVSAREIENPRIAKTDATDCVSCHVAQSARLWGIANYPQLDLDKTHLEAQYNSNTHSLKNLSRFPNVTSNLRGFGYFGAEPAISRRAIHESAEVADAMNRGPLNRAPFRRRR